MDDGVSPRAQSRHMEPVNVADLLPRRERCLDMSRVGAWLSGRRVAITGCGYIGSELARQVATFNPRGLTLIDSSEQALWNIKRAVPLGVPCYGDVRNARRMRALLMHTDIVFHAAALKHVPICEESPEDAYETNARGTRHVVDAAEKAQIVLVSTDKACRPSSVMGQTKLLAEKIVRESGRGSVVRFGNVIGSSGSVVPLWQEQIAGDGVLTVTDARMTRYMMTVGEAAELILQAGAMGATSPGNTYVLDMGEPVSIDALCDDFIRLSGCRDIRKVYSGIRPGEKLHEILSDQPLIETTVDGVMRVCE